ncbi:uncharacterized protein LOC120777869 [Bactrocera tryoni]|uniref:uncharacterized protein LOC120777869 n=1 Tax=Bactrocera tryoni TaxID=59916 RepID=UPI001A98D896|nr:uncharacterized protein LOC120777869 [Bactrocera tryoni]
MDIEENKEYRSELIKLVHKNEIIWDKTKKVRLSYAKKTAIWNSIGKELGKPGELVRKNWQSLRDQYRRDLKRQVVDGIESSWVHFDDMSFIRKFLRPRQFKACPDSEETEIVRRECHEKNMKTRGSHSKVFRTSGNFMTQIFPTAHDHSNAAYKEHQESGDSPPLANSAIHLHRPIKMNIHNESVETIKYNASMGPPHETANELLVPRAQIPKIRIKNLSARTDIKMRRKKCAVKKSREAQYSTRSRSNSNIIEACNESLTPKKSNTRIRENVSCINNVRFEQTHSQLENGAESTPGNQSQRIPLVLSTNKTSTNIEIPEIEIKDEVIILADEDDKVADTAATSENSTNIMEPEFSINEKNPVELTRNTSIYNTSKSKEIGKETTGKEDDDYHFVISLLPTLRRITHDRKLRTRMEIMKVVMEAAQSDNT